MGTSEYSEYFSVVHNILATYKPIQTHPSTYSSRKRASSETDNQPDSYRSPSLIDKGVQRLFQ